MVGLFHGARHVARELDRDAVLILQNPDDPERGAADESDVGHSSGPLRRAASAAAGNAVALEKVHDADIAEPELLAEFRKRAAAVVQGDNAAIAGGADHAARSIFSSSSISASVSLAMGAVLSPVLR